MKRNLEGKPCPKCGIEDVTRKHGYCSWCRGCDSRVDHSGVSEQDFVEKWLAQDGCCALCDTHLEKPNADHCHETGVFRGVLCMRCNSALGILGDNKEGLQRALEYVS